MAPKSTTCGSCLQWLNRVLNSCARALVLWSEFVFISSEIGCKVRYLFCDMRIFVPKSPIIGVFFQTPTPENGSTFAADFLNHDYAKVFDDICGMLGHERACRRFAPDRGATF